jgi:hypothetical protein
LSLGIWINRNPQGESFRFAELFTGFDDVEAVRGIFGQACSQVLGSTKVHLIEKDGYLRVDNDTGDILICAPYLRTADERHFYLDLIHELVHVRQHQDGKELYDRKYSYVDRPTEIEAYTVAVSEARRIGMNEGEIAEYLKVEWVSDEDFKRMLNTLGVQRPHGARRKA